eukprot:8247632-Pyramimonas_sp.AAC.1
MGEKGTVCHGAFFRAAARPRPCGGTRSRRRPARPPLTPWRSARGPSHARATSRGTGGRPAG